MSEPVELAKSARVCLVAALEALQENTHVPAELMDLAEPIAETMGILHAIERSGGAVLDRRDVALTHVRTVLGRLQHIGVAHPALDVVTEAVASSLAALHALSRFTPPPPAPQAFPQAPQRVSSPSVPQGYAAPPPTPQMQAAYVPAPQAQPAFAAAPAMQQAHAASAPQMQQAYAPAQQAYAPAPQQAYAPAPQMQPPYAAPTPQMQQPYPPQATTAPIPQPYQQAPYAYSGAGTPAQKPAHAYGHAAPAQQAAPAYAQAAPAQQATPAQQTAPAYAQAAPAPQAAPAYAPPPAHAYAPPPAPAHAMPQQAAPQVSPRAQAATVREPAVQAARQAAAAKAGKPDAGQPSHVEVELGTHSGSNFYKGLGGNDVIEHGGIFVATYKIPKIGATLVLRVLLPGDYEFHANAVVQWSREAGVSEGAAEPGFGARFTQISPEGRQLVYRYTRNREPLFYDDL